MTGAPVSLDGELSVGELRLTTFASTGGWTSTSAELTDPNEMSVAVSPRTGELEPCAKIDRRSGTPCAASQASWAEPSRPPSCLGAIETL